MPSFRYPFRLVIFSILLAVAGAVISGILLQHHVVAQIGGDPLFDNVCEATAALSCDEVIASEWGTLKVVAGQWELAIPTAMFGVVFFAAVGSWFIAVGVPQGSGRWLHIVPTLLTLAGLAASVGFEYIMLVLLDKLCPLCMATHVAILLLFVATLGMWRRRPIVSASAESQPAESQPAVMYVYPARRAVFAAFVLTVVASGLGWFIYRSQLHAGYAREYFVRWQDYDKDTRLNYDRFLAQPVLDIPISEEDPVRGPAEARHTLVVFSDFMCPACRALELTVIEQRRKEFPGQFRIVFKHFPLDKTCNPELTRTLHPGACAGAVAAEAARLLEGDEAFWSLHDAMFHSNTRFSTQWVYAEVEKLGIDVEAYKARFQTRSVWNQIHANIAEGQALGLESTPNMFLNGRQLKGWGDRHLWKYLLSEETLTASATRPATPTATQPATRPAATKTD